MKKDPGLSRSQQVASLIKELIVDKQLSKGDQLPSVRDLAKCFSTSPDMVGAALDMLNYEGIIITKARYGSFIANDSLLHMVDWSTITKKSAYNPSSDLMTRMFTQLDKGKQDISMHSVSDNFYMPLIEHGAEMAHKYMRKNYDMELYLNTGLSELKDSLAAYMSSYGMMVDPRQIVICNHIQDGLSMVADLLLHPHCCVFHETPGFITHHTYLKAKGIETVGLEMDDEGIQIPHLLHQASKRKRNMFLFTTALFSSPTGTTTSLARMKEILKICTNSGIPIVETDEYRGYDFSAPPTYYQLNNGQNIIYIGSFSRTFPFGFPFSWIVVPFRIVKNLVDIKFQHDWSVNMYMQILINEILKDGSYYDYLSKLHQHVRQREGFTRPIIEKHLYDVKITSALHPMSYWAKLPVSNTKLIENNVNISFTPGAVYSGRDDNHVIISKLHPKIQDYEQGIKALRNLIDSIK